MQPCHATYAAYLAANRFFACFDLCIAFLHLKKINRTIEAPQVGVCATL